MEVVHGNTKLFFYSSVCAFLCVCLCRAEKISIKVRFEISGGVKNRRAGSIKCVRELGVLQQFHSSSIGALP